MYSQKANDGTFKLVNLLHKCGEFQGKPYDNMELHVSYLFDKALVPGEPLFKTIKVRTAIFQTLGLKPEDIFVPFYDNFGNVVACKIL